MKIPVERCYRQKMGVVKGRRGSLNYKESCCLGGVSRNLHFLFSQTENSAVATGLEKVSFHPNPKERQCQDCSNYHTVALISHASKVILKILQARLQ